MQKNCFKKIVFCWRLEGENQCWVRIRDPVPFLTPGSGMMGKKTGSGYGMINPDHISEGLETNFSSYKILNLLMRIRDPGWKNSDPGSATLVRIKENIRYLK
jgi:hypothetical protein